MMPPAWRSASSTCCSFNFGFMDAARTSALRQVGSSSDFGTLSTPDNQGRRGFDNQGRRGFDNTDYRRSARPKKLAITGIASLSEVFGIYPGSRYQVRAEVLGALQ